jgi:hypothetical protein
MTICLKIRGGSGFVALLVTLGAGQASAAPLALSSLETGTSSPPPAASTRPIAISGAQVAAGLQVVNTARLAHREQAGYHEVDLFADAARSRAFVSQLKDGTETAFATSDTCFATATRFNAPPEMNQGPAEWDTFLADRVTLQTYAGDTSPRVVPVRAEKWVTENGKVHLETKLFWGDTHSGGTRLISQADTELTPVASPFAGITVYAFRSSPSAVSFFVRRDAPRDPAMPSLDPLARLGVARIGRSRAGSFDLSVMLATVQGETHVNPCAFEHVELELRPDPPAEESFAQAQARRLFRQLHKSPVPPSSPPPRDVANLLFAVVLDVQPEPSEAPPSDRPGFGTRTTVHVRTMALNFGLARAEQGEAVPSVSYRWLDRVRAISFR